MNFAFRPMTEAEIAERDRRRRELQAKLGGPDDEGMAFWIARALGYGIDYAKARHLWSQGMVLADMSEVTDEAVAKLLRGDPS